MAKFKEEITLSKEERTSINKLYGLTGKELYDKYGFKRAETVYATSETFDNGYTMDIKLVVGDTEDTCYSEAVLFNKKGSEVMCTEDVGDEVEGTWFMEYAGDTYEIEIK